MDVVKLNMKCTYQSSRISSVYSTDSVLDILILNRLKQLTDGLIYYFVHIWGNKQLCEWETSILKMWSTKKFQLTTRATSFGCWCYVTFFICSKSQKAWNFVASILNVLCVYTIHIFQYIRIKPITVIPSSIQLFWFESAISLAHKIMLTHTLLWH